MSERWHLRKNYKKSGNIESPAALERFFEEYDKLCQKHGLSLSHEDGHGAFIVEKYSEADIGWARDAMIGDSLDGEFDNETEGKS